MQHLGLKGGGNVGGDLGPMLGKVRGRTSWGCRAGVFGANPGPPLPGEIWLQVREANVWAMPPLAGQ